MSIAGAVALRRSSCSAAKATPACCSASSSRPTSRCAKRRSSSTTSPRRARRSRSTRSRSASCTARPTLTRAGHRAQPRDARQRAAVGSPAAARDVRADPGDPHLLRLRLGRQRSLRDQRPEPAGDAVGARAESGGAAQPHLGQRAARLHARPRPDARARSTRSRAKACRCCSCATCRRSSTVDIQITEPSIYFGELVERLRDRPHARRRSSTTRRATTTSTRTTPAPAACRSTRSGSKLLFAARFRSYQILLSDDITTESRLMFDRQIRRRVSKIAPFLVLDEDPYPVVQRRPHLLDPGRLHRHRSLSVLDARRGGVNYIRNSVKVVDRRLPRHGDVLPGRHRRSDRADAGEDLSRACSGR